MTWDLIIVGAGPGGMQAAIAASSEGLKVLVLERDQVGGQIGQTPLLENSVFANGGVTGPQFAEMMKAQALAMGATIQKAECVKLSAPASLGGEKRLSLVGPGGKKSTVRAWTVILAVGNKWAELDIPGLREQVNKRVHIGPVKSIGYNATGRDVAVYGGGPSAGQAILALAKEVNTRRVHVLMRSVLRMPQYLIDRIYEAEKTGRVDLYEHTVINTVERAGEGQINLRINDYDQPITVDGLFLCNGQAAATDWLDGTLDMDDYGRIVTGKGASALGTSMDGVYAIGDCRVGSTPRVGVAIGDGSMAITEVWGWFQKHPHCVRCGEVFAA